MSRQEIVMNILQSPMPDESVNRITGNVSRELKEIPLKWLAIFRGDGKGFAGAIGERLQVTDVSVLPSRDVPGKMDARVTAEIYVTEDMCNERGTLDEGLTVFLIDECSTTAMVVLSGYDGDYSPPGVSQTINTFYHSPAVVGMQLQIVNKALGSGKDSHSGVTEIWDKANHRLIASGSQITMPPSGPPNWASSS